MNPFRSNDKSHPRLNESNLMGDLQERRKA
jgi:hypothetical protein